MGRLPIMFALIAKLFSSKGLFTGLMMGYGLGASAQYDPSKNGNQYFNENVATANHIIGHSARERWLLWLRQGRPVDLPVPPDLSNIEHKLRDLRRLGTQATAAAVY